MNKSDLLMRSRRTFNALQRKTLSRAIDYATQKHTSQKRASGEDYITHPLSVAAILVDWGQDLETVIAGVLHDTVEDTGATLPDIEEKFGTTAAFLVDGVTKMTAVRRGMRGIDSYLPQTRDNLSKLLIAVGQDPRVLIIKLADRLHNLRTLQYLTEEKQQKIAKESLEVFARLADRLGMGKVRVEMEEIAFSYIDPKRYNYLRKLVKKRLFKAYIRMDSIKKEIGAELDSQRIKYTIDGRIKSIYSLHKKLAKCNEDIDEIYDLLAIRIIVKNSANCYTTMGVIHQLYNPIVQKIKDYIATPKPNGYQSLHTTVITGDEQIIEFQIRSEQMHEFAENGLAASFHYNEQKLTKNYFKRKTVTAVPEHLNWMSELKETAELIRDGVPIEEVKVDLFGDRIFVYSPKGDIYDLPEGSFPLDFAYAVHTELGQSAHSFLVNSKIARFTQELQNGDIVEVKTNKNVRPKSDWIKSTKTSKARNKIKARLRSFEV